MGTLARKLYQSRKHFFTLKIIHQTDFLFNHLTSLKINTEKNDILPNGQITVL